MLRSFGSLGTFHTVSGSTLNAHFVDADEAQLGSVSGSTATYNVVSGAVITVHSVDADKGRISDLSGSSATYHTVSGSLLQSIFGCRELKQMTLMLLRFRVLQRQQSTR